MKHTKRLLAILIAALILAVSAAPALAGTYTAVAGTTFNLPHSLELAKNDTPNPTVTYTFAITPDSGTVIAGDATAVPGTPTISENSTISYNGSTTYSNGDGTDYSRESTPVNVAFDFSSMSFNQPGIYRWRVTKTASNFNTNAGKVTNRNLDTNDTNATTTTQTFYVYALVTNSKGSSTAAEDQALTVTYLFSEAEDGNTPKGSSITDAYPASERVLILTKRVDGNMGDRTKEFEFTLTLQGTGTQTYNLTYSKDQDADALVTGNPTTIKFGSANAVTIKLKHDQHVKIDGLPEGVTYTITEAEATGYTTDATSTYGTYTANNRTVTGPLTGNERVTYTNTKQTDVPTGITLQMAAPLFGIALAGLLMAVVLFSKRRENH